MRDAVIRSNIMQPWGWDASGDRIGITDNTPCVAMKDADGIWHVTFSNGVSLKVEAQYVWFSAEMLEKQAHE